ncbi:MAG: orotate phosphoribosyltransferase [Nitrospira sp. SG-bin1]|nr:MAG: orotate phosphoribosyltransferase [Nitrospira sp. SG-bin1]
MSKKVLLLAVAVLFGAQAGLAMAANPDTGPGCGLGKVLWQDYKGQKEIAPQVLQATTNGSFGTGTFGISTGTLGCTNDGKFMSEHKTTMFASLNFEALTAEMAQGQGEHLASLATLMGVPTERHAAFFAMTQERYTSLVQAGEASPVALVKSLNDAIAGRPALAQVSVR